MISSKRGFTCGSFDLTHAGHFLMFEECKEHCGYLIVGLQTDPTLDRPEKNKPVQSIVERWYQLKACKFIDEVVVYDTEHSLLNLLKILKPDVRFVGSDHKDKPFTGDDLPIPLIFTSREHTYSSSSLRRRACNPRT